ncbi:MAG: DMT family transporter [Candidatus Marinimicrobia bacterium]|nr:DMT family transporter [Candidatus Neomarinimicrobiota bacterium]MCF7827924.1 DMT family transporter [Candidatus Neomarinimicrobiota bacterium]MCF7879321.1 DMT family transporter [Candidatus Neomarinimicrobiota bacterium]
MISATKKPLIADLSLVLIAFIWGTTFTVVKSALEDIEPFAFLVLRFGLAALILLPIIWYKSGFSRLPWKAGSLAGFFLFIGYMAQTIGLQYTTASKSGFITGLAVVMVPIFAAVFEKKSLGRWTAISVTLAVIGLYLLTNPQAQSFNQGDAWTLLCAVGFALHVIALDYYTRRVNLMGFFFIQILTVTVLSGIVLPFENSTLHILEHGLTWYVVGALIVTAVFATALAFFLQNWAQRITTATRTALILTLEPVFAALTGYVVLSEVLGVSGVIGGGLILLAIILAEILENRN